MVGGNGMGTSWVPGLGGQMVGVIGMGGAPCVPGMRGQMVGVIGMGAS